ncbi:hypothetical protein C8F01DRAFT_346317 [Mycena amicta]|nr:hypothetical protein C8F01DRAFT_346317 [Mycena amicta]
MNRLRKQSHGQRSDATSPPSNDNTVATRPSLQMTGNANQPVSQTLRAALGLPLSSSTQPQAYAVSSSFKSFATESTNIVQPRTRVEQYWAARAFAAETTLLGYEHSELRRAKDQELHDARHAKLERLVLILIALIAFIVLGLLALTFSHSHSPRNAKSRPAKHFTIPILVAVYQRRRARNIGHWEHDNRCSS